MLAEEKADGVRPRLATCSKPRAPLYWLLGGVSGGWGDRYVLTCRRDLPSVVGVEEAVWVI